MTVRPSSKTMPAEIALVGKASPVNDIRDLIRSPFEVSQSL